MDVALYTIIGGYSLFWSVPVPEMQKEENPPFAPNDVGDFSPIGHLNFEFPFLGVKYYCDTTLNAHR